MGALDPGAPTMSRLVDYPNTNAPANEIHSAVEGADTHMEHLVSQQMHASATWEDISVALHEMDPYELRVITCDNQDQVMEEPAVEEDADASHSPEHYRLGAAPTDCCSSFVRYGGSRMRLLPFLAASLQLVRAAKEGASRMVDLSTMLPAQFEGFCQGLETTPLGLQRMRYTLESRMRPRSDASVLEASLADLIDVCVPMKQALERARQRERDAREGAGRGGRHGLSGEARHHLRAIVDEAQDSSHEDGQDERSGTLLAQLGATARTRAARQLVDEQQESEEHAADADAHGESSVWTTATGKIRRLLCAPHL